MKFDYKKYKPAFLGVYLFMAFLMWAYFIASALEAPEQYDLGDAIVGGWVLSLLWPLLVTVELMRRVLF
tara:strand:+ start:269 stop:475 length:207 start_codon:yes stop_codon:yes gene_type:complete